MHPGPVIYTIIPLIICPVALFVYDNRVLEIGRLSSRYYYFAFSNIPYFNKNLIGNIQSNMLDRIKCLSLPIDGPQHYRRAAQSAMNWFSDTDWFWDKHVLSDKESIGDISWSY